MVFLISYVTPIPKKPHPLYFSDFRPICGTSEILKTLERYIKEQLMLHLKANNFLPEEQFGFRAGHSTTKQMVLFNEHITRSTEKKMTTDVIYMDVEKAFDQPKFEEMQKELIEAKIDGNLLNLIMFLLVHRVFLVKVNGKNSNETTADSGAGQGSVLGPILFIIFFSKLSKLLKNINGIIHFKFADDLKLLYSYFINDFDSTIMQKAIATVSDWCESKSMKVAPTKTFHVQFGPSNSNAKYSVNNIQIERKEVVRDLGFYIKNDCSINDHLDIIISNANRKYHSIFKKIIIKDEKILTKIFNIYIRPIYEYGSPLFNLPKKTIIKQLENGQKTFTRTMFRRNNPRITVIPTYGERLKLYEMTSLHQRRTVADIIMAYDFLVSNPNPNIDLRYVPLSSRSGGYYWSNHFAKGKFNSLHFSTRLSSILTNLNIKLHDYQSTKQLRNHLSTIDLTDEKIQKYSD
uniref:Reverse transcriptase domain-containing protein n=1 Tax=Panagrolaimus davidi TaxID=227884 RepID=A0A914PAL6_9BILA